VGSVLTPCWTLWSLIHVRRPLTGRLLQSDPSVLYLMKQYIHQCINRHASLYLPTTLVAQVEQWSDVCVCLSECPHNDVWTKWPLTHADIWCAGSTWYSLGRVPMSRSWVKVHEHRIVKRSFYGCECTLRGDYVRVSVQLCALSGRCDLEWGAFSLWPFMLASLSRLHAAVTWSVTLSRDLSRDLSPVKRMNMFCSKNFD